MSVSVYEFDDYKALLLKLVDSRSDLRGIRVRLADACACQASHVSNVLSGPGHFSLEQLEAAARFFGLSEEDTEYLLLVLSMNRAGSRSLKAVYKRMLDERRRSKAGLGSKLGISKALDPDIQAVYYSSWQYGAVHMALLIPEFRSAQAIAVRLGLTVSRVEEICAFFTRHGLVQQTGKFYTPLEAVVHLPKASPMDPVNHRNWRLRAMKGLDEKSSLGLHYSAVMTLSRDDVLFIKEKIERSLASITNRVKESGEDTIANLNVDFYEL